MKYISIVLVLILATLLVVNNGTVISKYLNNNLAYVIGSMSSSSGSGSSTDSSPNSGSGSSVSGLYTLRVNKVYLPENDDTLVKNSKLYISINGGNPSMIDKKYVGKFKPGTAIKLSVAGSSTIMAFDRWTGSECNKVVVGVCSFVMNNNKTINSHIAKLQTLTLKSVWHIAEMQAQTQGRGQGAIQVNNYSVNTKIPGQMLSYKFKYGTEVVLNPVPFANQKFLHFFVPSDVSSQGSTTTSPLKIKMIKDYYIGASFGL